LAGRRSVPMNKSSDLVLIATAHAAFRMHNFSRLRVPLVDTRNCVSAANRPKFYFQA
jgi:UDP-N-acetyl-D-mannosaminuronate dehydrogenase